APPLDRAARPSSWTRTAPSLSPPRLRETPAPARTMRGDDRSDPVYGRQRPGVEPLVGGNHVVRVRDLHRHAVGPGQCPGVRLLVEAAAARVRARLEDRP